MEGLDLHSQLILEEYRERLPQMEQLKEEVLRMLREAVDRNGLVVTAIEARVKTEESLAGKLALKGQKYACLDDITDIIGARIITFYTDDVDRIAAMAEQLFDIDWTNSVDKRKLHQLDSFGYNSLHYICRLNGVNFELQLRTTLQHAWAAINHDTGYKSGVEIPREYMRQMNRLAGMLELADDEFSRIRTEINDYRRHVQQLVQNGKLDDVSLEEIPSALICRCSRLKDSTNVSLPLIRRRYRKCLSFVISVCYSTWAARLWAMCNGLLTRIRKTPIVWRDIS